MSGNSNKSFKSAKSYISESSNSRSKEKNILNSVKSQLSESGKLKAKKKFINYLFHILKELLLILSTVLIIS